MTGISGYGILLLLLGSDLSRFVYRNVELIEILLP